MQYMLLINGRGKWLGKLTKVSRSRMVQPIRPMEGALEGRAGAYVS
jgi:hypothetical protein